MTRHMYDVACDGAGAQAQTAQWLATAECTRDRRTHSRRSREQTREGRFYERKSRHLIRSLSASLGDGRMRACRMHERLGDWRREDDE